MNVKELRAMQAALKANLRHEETYSSELVIRAEVHDPVHMRLVLLNPAGAAIDPSYLCPADLVIYALAKQHFQNWQEGLADNPLPTKEVAMKADNMFQDLLQRKVEE